MPWELERVLPRDIVHEGLRRLDWRAQLEASLQPDPRSDFGRVATLEASHYLRNQLLRDTDWASMAHSLEVRTPLVDAWLLRQAGAAFAALGTAGGKRLLAQVPRRALPAAVLARTKTGFQTPAADWMASAGLRARHCATHTGPDSAGRRSRDLAAALLSEAY
jgi:asparagine synthase (glutamine-hydrolysing)